MKQIEEGTLLWKPSHDRISHANINAYMNWLKEKKELSFPDYSSLWEWSVNHIEQFWESIWEYFDIRSSTPYHNVLGSHKMPGAKWFDGAKLNYVEQVFRNYKKDKTEISMD